MTTHRSAKVRIENKTGQRVLSVSVGHKYSNDYKSEHSWQGPIETNTKTAPADDMVVEFNTGFMTTGRDWWVVNWVTEDGKTHITDPKNMRGLMDFLEKGGLALLEPMAALKKLLVDTTMPELDKAADVSNALTNAIVKALCNTESTSGFKQHILREEDEKQTTAIVLKPDGVEFHSKSGTSKTGAKVLPIEDSLAKAS